MKKGDFLVIAICVCLAAALFCGLFFFRTQGETVTVTKGDKVIFEGSLYKDREISLDGNTVVIKGGYVFMKNASCKNQICVNTRKISDKGESIICLPNKVAVEIK